MNQIVEALQEGYFWNGNIVILHGAAHSDGVVNMQGNDARFADFALKMFALCSNF